MSLGRELGRERVHVPCHPGSHFKTSRKRRCSPPSRQAQQRGIRVCWAGVSDELAEEWGVGWWGERNTFACGSERCLYLTQMAAYIRCHSVEMKIVFCLGRESGVTFLCRQSDVGSDQAEGMSYLLSSGSSG